MHFKSTDLDFERLSIRSDQCGMQRLIHVRFRHCNIIFESSGNRLVHLVNDTKSCITVLNCVYQNTHCKKIVDLIDGLVLIDHLLINTEEMFHTSVYLRFNVGIVHVFLDFFYNGTYELFSFTLSQGNLLYQIVIDVRFQIFQ